MSDPPNGIYGTSGDHQSLDRLDGRELHHLGPLLGFVGDELAEVAGRAWKYRTAEVGETRRQLGIGKAGIDFFVEPVDDFGRRVLGDADAEPAACLVAGHE